MKLLSAAVLSTLLASVMAQLNVRDPKSVGVEAAFPALLEGTMCLDDLKEIDITAIVEPVGRPVIVKRKCTFEKGQIENDEDFVLHKFIVVSGVGEHQTELHVLTPMPPLGGGTVLPSLKLQDDGRFLLFAKKPTKGILRVSRFFRLTRIEQFPEWQTYFVKARPNEVSGWSLVKTDEKVLHDMGSVEETVLMAVADAVSVADPRTLFDPCRLVARISRYSERTEGIYTVEQRIESAANDFVGTTQTDKYFAEVLAPRILGRIKGRSERIRALLGVLAKWGSKEARQRLELPPPH